MIENTFCLFKIGVKVNFFKLVDVDVAMVQVILVVVQDEVIRLGYSHDCLVLVIVIIIVNVMIIVLTMVVLMCLIVIIIMVVSVRI